MSCTGWWRLKRAERTLNRLIFAIVPHFCYHCPMFSICANNFSLTCYRVVLPFVVLLWRERKGESVKEESATDESDYLSGPKFCKNSFAMCQ